VPAEKLAVINTRQAQPDHNSLGRAAFISGLCALILSFVPIIGFVAWLLSPLAILFGLIALARPSRSQAVAGIIFGSLALSICFSWIQATHSVGQAMNSDTFDNAGERKDLADALILDASIKTLWKDIEDNKIAAGQKYGNHRLKFMNEKIDDFSGTTSSPEISVVAASDGYLVHLVSVSFSEKDGKKLATLKKGRRVSFMCQTITESIGGGYSLSKCDLN
jgi:hypothetical protein